MIFVHGWWWAGVQGRTIAELTRDLCPPRDTVMSNAKGILKHVVGSRRLFDADARADLSASSSRLRRNWRTCIAQAYMRLLAAELISR